MRILLIGATGAIGRRVIPRLLQAGHAVTAVGRSEAARSAIAAAGAAPIALDIFDRRAAAQAAAGHEVLIDLATKIPTGPIRPFLPAAWKPNDRVRREGSAVLAAAAADASFARYIRESFAGIYEDGADRWLDETAPVRTAPYNRSVLDAERAAAEFTRNGGVGVALRFALFYGPGDPFSTLILDTARRGIFPMIGRPDGYLAQVHHDDAASAVVAALDLPAGIYNVVDDEPLTRRAFADALGQMLGVSRPRLPPAWVARLGGQVGETLGRSLRLSNRKLRTATSWRPRYSSAVEGWRAILGGVEAVR